MDKVLSVGIIGGADGPTAIFVTGRFPWEILLVSAVFIGAVIWLAGKMR